MKVVQVAFKSPHSKFKGHCQRTLTGGTGKQNEIGWHGYIRDAIINKYANIKNGFKDN